MLPGMDGFELTQRVKEDFRTSHIPVLMLTAKSQIDAKIEGSKAGADVYLTKPFNTTHLTETIKTILNNRAKIQRRFSSEYVFANENKTEKRFLNELTARIEAHIADTEFGVEKLSTDMGMSRVQLYRKVHALLQMNVNDYITEIRINKAKALLRDTNKSIADVAYETGFNSAAYFTTLFRQKQHQTPSEFRKGVGV
jgi:AraC-like DNA-binding protein